MTAADVRQLALTRVVDAPCALVYRAFTDPDDLAAWWGPVGTELLRDEIDCDVRPGGHQRWTEVNASTPELRVQVRFDLDAVVENELIDGRMRVTGRLPDNIEPFETRLRVEFFDESDGRTRIEIRQWVPVSVAGPTAQGWREAFTKLDAALAGAGADRIEV